MITFAKNSHLIVVINENKFRPSGYSRTLWLGGNQKLVNINGGVHGLKRRVLVVANVFVDSKLRRLLGRCRMELGTNILLGRIKVESRVQQLIKPFCWRKSFCNKIKLETVAYIFF